jgi:hypothetical protein
MQRTIVIVVGVVTAAAVALVAPVAWAAASGAALLAAAWWMVARCHHTGQLGLLPPTTMADGSRLPARWFCDACGHTWEASFERDSVPVVKYTGYDQTKAPLAAKQAADLRERQQAAAVRRAGYTTTRRPVPSAKPAEQPSPLVAFQKARARVAR